MVLRTAEQRRRDYVAFAENNAISEERAARGRRAVYLSATGEPPMLTLHGQRIADAASNDAEAKWNAAVALWNATPESEDGDEKYCAVERVFGDELANEMALMDKELGKVE